MATPPLSSRLLFQFCCTVAAPVGAAPQIAFDLGRIEAGPVSAENVSALLDLHPGGAAELRIQAARLALPASTTLDALEVRCERGYLDGGKILCADGWFSAEHSAHGRVTGRISLAYERSTGAAQLAIAPLKLGGTVLEGALQRSEQGWSVEFAGQGIDLAVLQEYLDALHWWPQEYSDAAGTVDVALRAHGAGQEIAHVEGAVRTFSAGVLGPNSAENLSLETTFAADFSDDWSFRADGRMSGGLLYIEPGLELQGLRPGLTLEAPAEPIRFGVDAQWWPEDRRLKLTRLDLNHPGVVQAHASADVQIQGPLTIAAADLVLRDASAGSLYATYLQPFLLNTQFNALELAGGLSVSARVSDGGLRDLAVALSDLHAYDGNGRFSIAGLDGSLRVNSGPEPVASSLSWQGAGVYRLTLGPGGLDLSSVAGDVEVLKWRDLPILDGGLHIQSLEVRNAGRADMVVKLDGEVTPISMADLTQALGWPVMAGKLTGRIDGLTWSGGTLAVGGAIEIGLFGGRVAVRNLRVGDLFGFVPVLRADVDIQDIDLAQLTDRFSFGRIEGRLGGKIHGLELQAWQPVYFEAELATPEDDRTRHRISQRAVDNLGFIGGGSTAALSGGFLRFFQEYSYGRIGISCRLYNGACELGGVEETGDGFLILTQGGLLPPWIEVKGTGRSIGWHDLVQGLKRIASERPEIR
jgi:hypothetical protein